MAEKKNRIKKILRMLLFLVFVLGLFVAYLYAINDGVRNNIDIGTDADVTINGMTYENVSLSEFSFEGTKKGDTIVAQIRLPDTEVIGAMIEFRVYHSVVKVYLDGEKIYGFGEESAAKGLMVGSGTHFVSLPADYQGKILEIGLDITEDDAFTIFGDVNFQSQLGIIENYIQKNFFQILASVFMIGIGIMLVGIIIIMGNVSSEYRELIWLAGCCVSAALWIMSSTGIIQFLISDFRVVAYIEYLSLDFMLFFFLIFVFGQHQDNRVKSIVGILAGVTAVFIVLSLVCDYMGTAHLPQFLSAFHVLAFVTVCITITASFIRWLHNKDSAEGILLKGIVTMLVVLSLDMFRFNAQKYLPKYFYDLNISVLPIGIIIFIASMFAMYVTKMMKSVTENIERQTLMQLAYTDVLTGVPNRAKCESMMNLFDETIDEYTLYNFDLNDFKKVNDTYGHSRGDRLLIDFAKTAEKVFKNKGFIGRMGGDEFLGLVDSGSEEQAENLMRDLLEELDKINEKNRKYKKSSEEECDISVSYGYKIKHSKDQSSVWDVYKAADKKMYQYKEDYKNHLI